MIQQNIINSIEQASKVIGKTWPLYSFVTSNPLSGYETMPFEKAAKQAGTFLNTNVFPKASVYRNAWEQGEIDVHEIEQLLLENGLTESPEHYLKQLEQVTCSKQNNKFHVLDRIMTKWLATFLDEGLADWEMPNKKRGFYKSWRKLAKYDSEIGVKTIQEIPKTSEEALLEALNNYPESEYQHIFTEHLAALPGWVGYINHRCETNSDWQQKYPISVMDYLAVRLWIARKLNLEILSENNKVETNISILKLQYIWLKAWENSWQNDLAKTLESQSISFEGLSKPDASVDAQMVFCIDTRSELIRRHIEANGRYETYGYAGFFGIAMDYENLNDGLSRKSCPPILQSAYKTFEISQPNKDKDMLAYKKKADVYNFANYFLRRMKNILPSAFGYVEGSGFFYGISLFFRTLVPGYLYKTKQKNSKEVESVCEPEISNRTGLHKKQDGISIDEKVAIVKSAFDLMGWKQFAPIVLFVGHGSHSANNAFGSSLDCGACAASPGRHNARMLAKLANMQDVRNVLAKDFDIKIPDGTIFIGAEHNTTTDEIVIFDSEVPKSHIQLLNHVKEDLLKAQHTATKERLNISKKSIALAYKKANNWSETRPEWGLAKNAGFIVGPRAMTKGTNLDGRCFLHSYNWELDKTGKALQAIMQGPMVVTQWINNHYYFASVDNDVFGGGSKITHNITGKFGVVQGNGGDLKMGLPLQSINKSDAAIYHQPLRLSVVIQAPVARVTDILLRNEHLKSLLDNEWIYLMVMDPTEDNAMKKYRKNMKWISISKVNNQTVKKSDKVKDQVLEEV